MYINNFNDWSLNENITSDKLDKVFTDAKKWSSLTGIEIEIKNEGIGKYSSNYIWVNNIFGLWRLELEEGKKKGNISDYSFSQQYSDTGSFKWYITYPSEFNRYNHRANYNPGNFNTFKKIIENFNESKKVFDKISFFMENSLGVKGIDTNFKNSNEKYVVKVVGKNLKSLSAKFIVNCDVNGKWSFNDKSPSMYSNIKINTEWSEKEIDIDPSKGEILYYFLKGYMKELSQEIIDKFMIALEVLENMKNLPIDEVLKKTESGDWKKIASDLKILGKITAKKYGI